MIVRKRFLAVLMALCMVLTLMPGTVLAAPISGVYGDNLFWTLDDGGTLTVHGNGVMEDYKYTEAPWYRYKKSIEIVNIDVDITRIGTYAFYGCHNLISIKIPYSVVSIGRGAFYKNNRMTNITLPYGIETIEKQVFVGCTSLTDITLPDSVTSIGTHAFLECYGLTSVTLSNNLTNIENGAFRECTNLTSITIPNSLTRLEDYLFYGCSSLTRVTLPNSIRSIGIGVFNECSQLAHVYYSGTRAQWRSISIDEDNEFLTSSIIHCSDGDIINGSTPIEPEPDDGQLHGEISVSSVYNPSGERVTLRVTPDPGYQLSSISVTDSGGYRPVTVSGSGNTYTFYMPAYDVTVHAKFTKT